MPQDQYAPPGAPLAESHARGTGAFELGACLSEGWTLTWANFPLWLGAGLVWYLASLLAAMTLLGIPLVLPVLTWGGVLFLLNMVDRRAALRDVFAGFSSYGSVLLTMLALSSLLFLIALAGQSLQLFGALSGRVEVEVIGALIYLAWFIFVLLRIYFSMFLVVDRGMGAIEALGASWAATRGLTLRLALLALLSTLVFVAGFLVFVIGVIPALVIVYLMWASAYRQIFGGPRAA